MLHLLHYSGLLHQSSKILDGQWGYHQADISPKVVLEFSASSLLIEWQGVEVAEMFELLSIFRH